MWWTLLPLIAGSALVPMQMVVTLLLLRRPVGGTLVAISLIGGMISVRLVQGVLFGLLFPGDSTDPASSAKDGSSPVVSSILIAVAVVLYAAAVKQLLTDQDPDAPPPKWMTLTESLSAAKAFLLGAGLLLIGAKFWVFTLGAVAAIRDSGVGTTTGVLTFIAYAVLCSAVLFGFVAMKVALPTGSARVLAASGQWLERHNGAVVVALGAVFGTWFLVKGLVGLGVL